jgi:hypothetical protein
MVDQRDTQLTVPIEIRHSDSSGLRGSRFVCRVGNSTATPWALTAGAARIAVSTLLTAHPTSKRIADLHADEWHHSNGHKRIAQQSITEPIAWLVDRCQRFGRPQSLIPLNAPTSLRWAQDPRPRSSSIDFMLTLGIEKLRGIFSCFSRDAIPDELGSLSELVSKRMPTL